MADQPTAPVIAARLLQANRITWTDGADNVAVRVHRATTPIVGPEVASVPAGVQFYQDGALLPKTTYYYALKGDDGSVLSAPTPVVSGVTLSDDVVIAELEKIAYDWAVLACASIGGRVIFEKQDGTKPKKPFVTLLLSGPDKVGFDDAKTVEAGKIILGGQRHFNLSINIYGKDNEATQCAFDIQRSVDEPLIEEFLKDRGVAFGIVGDVVDLSSLLETKTESRAQFDIQVRKTARKDVTGQVEEIETVPFSLTKGDFNNG